MPNATLVINAGSSSIKFAGYVHNGSTDEPSLLGKGQIEGIGTHPHFIVKDNDGNVAGEHHWPEGDQLNHTGGLRFLIDWIQQNAEDVKVTAAGHRVVHGGLTYSGPTRINAEVMANLEKLVPLAPLHQPHNLAAIRALQEVDPHLPQVACFDTAFHRTQPAVASMFALPRSFTERGVRRYGFHGLSYEYIARRLPDFAPEASRVVVAHLGSGASMCAIKDGRSVETTMGFTALDGLPMGTRTGVLDPGVLLYCIQTLGMDATALEKMLYHDSGLLGVSGISNDMRDLITSDDPRAAEAVDLFVYHIAKQTAALSAALQGIDALVFTAGIGENSVPVRERVCNHLEWLGIRLDAQANAARGPRISTPDSPVSTWVIPTDEERMIAIHTAQTLDQ